MNTNIDNALDKATEFLKDDSGLVADDSTLGIKASGPVDELDSEDKADALEIVLKSGCLYRINSRCWSGVTSRVPEEQIKAPKEILKGLKNLIEQDRLQPFRFWKTAGERELKKYGYNFLGLRGVYFIPKGFIPFVEKKLKLCQQKAMEARADFLTNFDQYKSEWRDRVIQICKDKDISIEEALAYLDDDLYPSETAIAGRFQFSHRKFFISVPYPGMGILTDDEYREEVAKQKEEAAEFLDNCIASLAKKFYQIISKIQEKVKKGESIRPNTLQALADYTEVFDKMNITSNGDLAEYVKQAEQIFGGVNAGDFKQDDFRNKIEESLDEIVTDFKTKADEKLLRDIDF